MNDFQTTEQRIADLMKCGLLRDEAQEIVERQIAAATSDE